MKKILLAFFGLFFLIPMTFPIDMSFVRPEYTRNNAGYKPAKYGKTSSYQSTQKNDFSTVPADKKNHSINLNNKVYSNPSKNINKSISIENNTNQSNTKTKTTSYTSPSDSMMTKSSSNERSTPITTSSSDIKDN